MILIYYSSISKEKHKFLLEKFLTSFSTDFQEKVQKYRRWEDAQVSLLGRLLLRYGMIQTNYNRDEELVFNDYNKPYFKDQNLRFNISHSKDTVVCAISDQCEIGIDIEFIEDIDIEDFKFQMTPREWERISFSNHPKNEFFNYWTQKEAVIKAYGMGLSMPLNAFEVENNVASIGLDNFVLEEIKTEVDYKCHIAFRGAAWPDEILSPEKISIATILDVLR